MKKKKIFTQNKKRAIASLLLTFILLVGFNFSPISLLAGVIRDKVLAYKSSTIQSYYTNAEVSTETNISAGNYPSSLEKYFKDSSNNFNIQVYYDQRFTDLYAQKVEDYLLHFTNLHGSGSQSTLTYVDIYKKYLDYVNQDTLSDYYNANKDKTEFSKYNDFRDFFEDFVLNTHEFTVSETSGAEPTTITYVLPAPFNTETIGESILGYYEPYIYNALANYFDSGNVGEIDKENNDGLTATTEDFYADSKTYNRFKAILDKEIEETVAIYAYDHETQNNYVAGVVATDAPSSMYYYYRDNAYEQVQIPNATYNYGTYYTQENVAYSHINYYYFGLKSQLETAISTTPYAAEYDKVKAWVTEEKESVLQTNPLKYRRVVEGEEGYLGENFPIYKQYGSIPYIVTNSQYDIYVVMDNLSDSMQATLDSLYYFHPITREQLKEDQFQKDNLGNLLDGEEGSNGKKDLKYNDNRFYVQIPYDKEASWGDFWYTYLFGYISSGSDAYFENFLKKILTDEHGNSQVYLRLQEDTTKVVYINTDEGITLEEFNERNPNYAYKTIKAVSFSDPQYNADDFYQIDSNNFSSYLSNITTGTKVYFLKQKVFYQTLDTKDDVYQKDNDGHYVYETTPTPNTSYEQQNVPTEDYVKFQESGTGLNQVYILVDSILDEVTTRSVTISGKSYNAKLITQTSIDSSRNFYVKVPEYLAKQITVSNAEDGETFDFYYMHTSTTQNKIYVVDSTDEAKNNEVYKNLYYSVITDDEYNAQYYNYELIPSTDPNYNEKLKLYYRYNYDLTPPTDGSTNEDYAKLFIQNEITGTNAIYIVDDSLTSSDKATYKNLYYTSITSAEYRTNSAFYVQLTEKDVEKYGDKGRYATLYYKYIKSPAVDSTKYKIYEYTTNTNSSYSTFTDTDQDFVASDYELITPDDSNYVVGKNLYYKKLRTERYIGGEDDKQYQSTYYHFNSSSNISIKANSYYAISFYLYTNGHVYNADQAGKDLDERTRLTPDGDKTDDVTASVYLTDTTGHIEEIAFENLTTHGEWKQYYAFVATDLVSASTLTLSIYLGNKSGIAGPVQNEDLIVNGMVLVDDIKIVLINQTDYNKHSIDDVDVYYTPEKTEDDGTESSTQSNEPSTTTYEHADKYGNEIVITYHDNTIKNDSIVENWTNMFDFDAHTDLFTTTDEPSTSKLQEAFNKYFEYYQDNPEQSSKYGIFDRDLTLDSYTDNLLWHYYISRNNFADKDYQKFLVYKQAYSTGKLTASIVDEPSALDKTPTDDEEEDKDTENKDDNKDDKDKEDDNDIPFVDSTFGLNNKVLMLKNADRQRALGVVSRPFTIRQNEYYKISMWILSTNKDAKATINLESIQKTEKTATAGTLLSTSANINARLKDYTSTPTSEYGWINVSFFIEGNAYGDEEVFLALLADANETVYFDNITIQRVTSALYSNASSDSDSTTYVLSLAPSTSLISQNVTNGFFNSVNVTDNYGSIVDGEPVDVDYTKPRTAKNWTVLSTNPTDVIAGVVPTSQEYLDKDKTFYSEYNNYSSSGSQPQPFNLAENPRYANNVFGIYVPKEINSGFKDDKRTYTLSTAGLSYKIYSTSVSLSANSTVELSFQFFAGYNFKGNMVANIYSGSVDASKLLTSFKIPYDNTSNENSKWDTYKFFVQNGISSSSVYIEIGVEDAVGTSFFQKVASNKSKYTSVNEARDALINLEDNATNIFENESLSSYRFVNLGDSALSIHSQDKNENGTYAPKEYASNQTNTSKNTVGRSGVAVANFYEKTTNLEYYTVTIDKVTYYIKGEEVTDADENTTTVYKLYSDSVFKNEVTEINGKSFTIEPGTSGKTLKVLVGGNQTSYDGAAVEKTNYVYEFNDDVVIGDHFIEAAELKNNVSENVLILSNSLTTDYTSYSPVYTKTLSTSAYYVLKIYVKTSHITSSKVDVDSGLNITISSISTSWTNIDTTKVEQDATDENNGFVCYQVLISTNTSSIASFGVQFSLGSEEAPCSGYAIIAGVTLESFGSETLFNEYASTIDDDDTTVKRFYGEASSNKDDEDKEEEENSRTIWATFFYIFSSLLLGIVLIVAIVAIVVKKHPIKFSNKYSSAESIVVTPEPQTRKSTSKRKPKKDNLDQDLTVDENEQDDSNNDNNEEGFV